ncbi:MAG TPA: flavin reductase family protein [Opitutaceae bacterium]
MDSHILPVALEKAYRLINHGPTVLVSATHGGVDNVMTAAWACGLDFSPPKVTVVIDRSTKTRELIEASGRFVLQVPNVRQAKLAYDVGSMSLAEHPDKLERCGVELFRIDGFQPPFVAGCSAWLACTLIPEAHNQETYDLFIGEVTGAWADDRVFKNGHWDFEHADREWRSLHHIAGGHFYTIGEPLSACPDKK